MFPLSLGSAESPPPPADRRWSKFSMYSQVPQMSPKYCRTRIIHTRACCQWVLVIYHDAEKKKGLKTFFCRHNNHHGTSNIQSNRCTFSVMINLEEEKKKRNFVSGLNQHSCHGSRCLCCLSSEAELAEE